MIHKDHNMGDEISLDMIEDINDLDKLEDDDLMDILCGIDFGKDNSINVDKEKELPSNVCRNCKQKDTLCNEVSDGVVVCYNCGQVADYIIDENPEWKNYDDSKSDMSRCSMPTNPLNPTVGTSISGNYRSKLHMLHNWSSLTYKNRNLYQVFNFISDKCGKGGISKCIEDDAKVMYKNIYECKHQSGVNKGRAIIIRGANRQSLIAACVYFACRKYHKTRSPKEIANLFGIDYTDITKGSKKFLELIRMKNINVDIDVNKPEDFVPRYCKELKIKGKFVEEATKLAKNTRRLNIATRHTPLSIATACILQVAEMHDLTVNKRSIAEIVNVSEVTISKTCKAIEQAREILLDDEKVDDIVRQIEEKRQMLSRPPLLEKMYRDTREPITNVKLDINTSDIRSYAIDLSSESYEDALDAETRISKVMLEHENILHNSSSSIKSSSL